MKYRVIALDLFGTVFDLADTPREEIKDYIAQVNAFHDTGYFKTLKLPESWANLKPFADAAEGLAMLERDHHVTTCTNAPLHLQERLLENSGLDFDNLSSFEDGRIRAYKPHPQCYLSVPWYARCKPSECLMVTGNEGSPDIEGAKAVGMDAIKIRGDAELKTIIDLAKWLGV
jgi:HAD superfamily hydrolase (TIGR01493 family)